MFDDQGIYHTETFNQPQTGAAQILDILNQPQSYQNYQKAAARQSEADIANQATQGEKHGQDFSQYPEYQNANDTLGISSDTASGIFGNIPQQKLKAALAAAQAAKGDEPLDEDDVSKVYLNQGVTPPTSYLNSSAKRDAAEAKAETQFQAQAAKAGDAAYNQAWGQGLTDAQARQAKIDAIRNAHVTAGHDIDPEQETNWAKYVAAGSATAGPKVTQTVATGASREAMNYANTDWIAAKTDTADAMRDPTVAAEWAKMGLDKARTGLIGVQTTLDQIKNQNGGFTAAGYVAAQKALVGFEKDIATATGPSHMLDNAQQKAQAAKVAKQAQAALDATKAKLAAMNPNPDAQAGALQALGGAQQAPPKPKYKPNTTYQSPSTGKTFVTDANGNPQEQGPPAQ